MTNGEKFKTVKERTIEFRKFCTNKICKGRDANCIFSDKIHDKFHHKCEFAWLDLEYKAALKPCPFCGGEAKVASSIHQGCEYHCVECTKCHVSSIGAILADESISAWNRRVS